ncbi:transposase [Streptomyces sp. NPDC059680]|uniref:transposase n=1 Tax=Streptomyces sp. NPDC059680 TaxID=3346904 RepID=UPI00367DF9BC
MLHRTHSGSKVGRAPSLESAQPHAPGPKPDPLLPPEEPIHLVIVNGPSHVAKKTKGWLATRPRFNIHHTPKHASWLNQVELFFSTLTRRLLRRGQFASRDELAAAIDTFVLAYDEHDAKPYRWTYDGSPLKAA